MREPGSGTRAVQERALARLKLPVRVVMALGSTEAIKRVVASGDGLGCLSRHAVEQSLADGHLAELRTRLPPATRRLATVMHREKRLGRTTADFLRHCDATIPRPRRQ